MIRAERWGGLLMLAALLVACSGPPTGAGRQPVAARLFGPCSAALGVAQPSWSPDGMSVAYMSISGMSPARIGLVDRNGAHPRLFDVAVYSSVPYSWSPDSRRIAFVSGKYGDYHIHLLDIDSAQDTRLADPPGMNFSPIWSPDGKRIAFVAGQQGSSSIYLINGDGTGLVRLGRQYVSIYDVAWSLDGNSLIFGGQDSHQSLAIYTMNADGTHEKFLVKDQIGRRIWSPDRTRFVYASDGPTTSDIFAGEIDQVETSQLTNNGEAGSPDWSPDGAHVVFSAVLGNHPDLFVMNADGASQTRLTDDRWLDDAPDWSPDGKTIVYVSSRPSPEVYRIDATGSNPVRLTQNPGNLRCLKWPF